MHRISPWMSLLLLGALTACGADRPETTPPTYRINSIVPSPAKPGQQVLVLGKLPSTATVKLGALCLAATPTAGGLQVTLPEQVLAGEITLTVDTPDLTLTGRVVVVPVVQDVTVNGTTLRIQGLGFWQDGRFSPQARLWVKNTQVTPEVKDGLLWAELPFQGYYGEVPISVEVSGQRSEIFYAVHAAGALQGQVQLPAQAAQQVRKQTVAKQLSVNTTTLLVRQSTLKEVQSWMQGRSLQPTSLQELLGVVQVSFSTHEEASQARMILQEHRQVDAPAPIQVESSPVVQASTSGKQWFWKKLGVPDKPIFTGEGLTVAVIDTGILEHPDLKHALLPGFDFLDNDTSTGDLDGHGTHVAGLIAARGDVVRGGAPAAKIVPVRVVSEKLGKGGVFELSQGILWAVNRLPGHPNPHPADIINLSVGIDSPDPLLQEAIQTAWSSGALLVAATGNSGSSVMYPAGYPEVIGVTSVSGPTLIYQPPYASTGMGTVLSAFGGDTSQDQDKDGTTDGIYSTFVDAQGQPSHAYLQGTSMAAPQVAALAAQHLSAGTPPALLRTTLEHSSLDLGVMGKDERYGHGLIQPPGGTEQLYAVVREKNSGKVLSWARVDSELHYQVNDLPGNRDVEVVVASDHDSDGILGEAGDTWAQSTPLTTTSRVVGWVPLLTLELTDGTEPINLILTPSKKEF